MVRFKKKVVSIKIDELFFRDNFEPARVKLQKQLGLSNLSQPKFTSLLHQKGLRLDSIIKKPKRKKK